MGSKLPVTADRPCRTSLCPAFSRKKMKRSGALAATWDRSDSETFRHRHAAAWRSRAGERGVEAARPPTVRWARPQVGAKLIRFRLHLSRYLGWRTL